MLPKYIETHRIKNKDELMQMMEVVKARQSKFAKFEKNIDTLLNINLKKGTLSYRILLVTMTEIIEYSQWAKEQKEGKYNDTQIRNNTIIRDYIFGILGGVLFIHKKHITFDKN